VKPRLKTTQIVLKEEEGRIRKGRTGGLTNDIIRTGKNGEVTNDRIRIGRNGGVTNDRIRIGRNGGVTNDSKILIKFQNNYAC